MRNFNKNSPQDSEFGDEVLEGATTEQKHLARIERYGKARARATEMIAYLEALAEPESKRYGYELTLLRDCGTYLAFRNYFTIGEIRLSALKSCKKHLLCPLCAIRRGGKALRVYLGRFSEIVAYRPNLKPWLVTFTVANGIDLDERQRHLAGCYRRLCNRRRLWLAGTKRAKWTETAKAHGAVWSYEVTNIGNGWHPHLHAVWLCEQEPDRWALVDEWKAITGDSCVVHTKPFEEDLVKGFCEVFKYAMKFSELSLADNLHAYDVLRRRRLLGSFGCFRGIEVPEDLTDELLDELPYIELFYRYLHGKGYQYTP